MDKEFSNRTLTNAYEAVIIDEMVTYNCLFEYFCVINNK